MIFYIFVIYLNKIVGVSSHPAPVYVVRGKSRVGELCQEVVVEADVVCLFVRLIERQHRPVCFVSSVKVKEI